MHTLASTLHSLAHHLGEAHNELKPNRLRRQELRRHWALLPSCVVPLNLRLIQPLLHGRRQHRQPGSCAAPGCCHIVKTPQHRRCSSAMLWQQRLVCSYDECVRCQQGATCRQSGSCCMQEVRQRLLLTAGWVMAQGAACLVRSGNGRVWRELPAVRCLSAWQTTSCQGALLETSSAGLVWVRRAHSRSCWGIKQGAWVGALCAHVSCWCGCRLV
jgi:hypothetical protein